MAVVVAVVVVVAARQDKTAANDGLQEHGRQGGYLRRSAVLCQNGASTSSRTPAVDGVMVVGIQERWRAGQVMMARIRY